MNDTNIFGCKTILCCNIDVRGCIVSVYNTSLSEDFEPIGLINKEKRKKELEYILKLMKENDKNIKNDELFENYRRKSIHFLTSSLKINDKDNGILGEEYLNMLSQHNLVDVYKYLNKDNGYTKITKLRHDYILMILTDELLKSKKYASKIKKLQYPKDLFKIIFKKYKVHFFEMNVSKNNILNKNYPVECVIMLKHGK